MDVEEKKKEPVFPQEVYEVICLSVNGPKEKGAVLKELLLKELGEG